MCTVTFIPSEDGVYLTSNRDEQHTRTTAAVPERHFINGCELLYPTDGDAGGSWIAVRNDGDAAVLLNGAFVNHVPANQYRKSRGLVFVEMMQANHPDKYFHATNLNGIAPFTVVLYVNRSLREYRWDGSDKHCTVKDQTLPHIWSSVTLYDAKATLERETWFGEWLAETGTIDTDVVFSFHRYGGKGDMENDLVINRHKKLYTVSITSVCIKHESATMNYFDMVKSRAYAGSISIGDRQSYKESFFERLLYKLKKTMIVAGSWEYWPFHLVYAPLYPYWFYLSLKARSFFFFSQANPSIENAGFTNERKSLIYAMMPKEYYPKTVFCRNSFALDKVKLLLAEQSLYYPMIAKPDIGEKGTKVKLLHNVDDLGSYAASSKVDFLLQEFISYEAEAGIFYYRMPGEKTGKISGITGKEFLAVIGNGTDTIETLIKKNKRFFLQLPELKIEYGNFLQTVLLDGEMHKLVPYGNHARGARFVDLSHRITPALTARIDHFCQQVPDFYFGRLDIKFRSWEDLAAGNHFSVIELNGAGSEPTHMYDPSHTLFFAWKEIIRHWNLLYKISMRNAQRTGMHFMKTGEGLQLLREHNTYMKLITADNK